ncbi:MULTISPECIES: disulfide bond formation protein B [unclassified Halomonas]|uniref:disulfide bond formation protein B n=1 Tax=unclassified Halomonas TaxID=2609666 RepID=UPI0020A0DFF3|nr:MULTISPECIES: disulfide bond formation protein B [unclassified Halomonas]MCP1313491.1 disulfide bond formation protein B [Halomonas sp. 707D7]MCP1327151.1 disulfide bond formation protein B [Halomonas sp. 707D4]
MKPSAIRPIAWAGFVFCVLMMTVALVLEHVVGLEPCPLCIFQRVAVIAAGIVFLVAALHNPKGRVGKAIYGVLGLASIGTGAFIAGRHVWLQHLPASEVPSCGPGLDYMMDILPLRDVVSLVLTGSGECAEIDFTFLGLSLPAWTLIGFLILSLAALRILWLAFKR